MSGRKVSIKVAIADKVIAFFLGMKLYFRSFLSDSVPLLVLTAAWNSLSRNALAQSCKYQYCDKE